MMTHEENQYPQEQIKCASNVLPHITRSYGQASSEDPANKE
jgi:hypothetical protein